MLGTVLVPRDYYWKGRKHVCLCGGREGENNPKSFFLEFDGALEIIIFNLFILSLIELRTNRAEDITQPVKYKSEELSLSLEPA